MVQQEAPAHRLLIVEIYSLQFSTVLTYLALRNHLPGAEVFPNRLRGNLLTGALVCLREDVPGAQILEKCLDILHCCSELANKKEYVKHIPRSQLQTP